MERIILTASPGMVLTNGRTTGHTIYLAEGENPETYHQVSENEFLAAIENPAGAEDYQSALAEWGVIL